MSPALNHPHHPLNVAGEPTYGELHTATAEALETAMDHGSGPFRSDAEAAAAVAGYQRFLAVAGRHLALLTAPCSRTRHGNLPSASGMRQPPVQRLIGRLTGLPLPDTNPSAWSRAATLLGAAHDLLATHLTPDGHLSPVIGDLLSHATVRAAAAARLLTLLAPAAAVGRQLVTSARALRAPEATSGEVSASVARLQPTLRELPILIDHARTQLEATSLWDSVPVAGLREWDALTPAVPTGIPAAGSVQFAAAITALRVLRVLTHRQATGVEDASPRSLYDLSRLAVTATNLTLTRLPAPTTALQRVHHAAQVDRLEAARDAWDTAGTLLATQVRGLTAATPVYKEALTRSTWGLQHSNTNGVDRADLTDRVDRALLAALPRLGHDAAATLTRMAARRELVAPVRRAGGMATDWHPVTPDHAHVLARGFTTAAHASRDAWDLTRATPHWVSGTGTGDHASAPGRRLTTTRTVAVSR